MPIKCANDSVFSFSSFYPPANPVDWYQVPLSRRPQVRSLPKFGFRAGLVGYQSHLGVENTRQPIVSPLHTPLSFTIRQRILAVVILGIQ